MVLWLVVGFSLVVWVRYNGRLVREVGTLSVSVSGVVSVCVIIRVSTRVIFIVSVTDRGMVIVMVMIIVRAMLMVNINVWVSG